MKLWQTINRNLIYMVLSPLRKYVSALFEPFIRAIALLCGCVGKDIEGVELVLRGIFLGGRSGWRIGRRVRFVGPASKFDLGKGVSIYGDCYLNSNGTNGFIKIGNYTHIDVACVIYGQGGVTIGKNCAIAAGALIYSQTNNDSSKDGTPVSLQPVRYSAVLIGNGCWLGAGVRIMPGVSVGDLVTIGAGAVVLKDIAPGNTVVGVPAKLI